MMKRLTKQIDALVTMDQAALAAAWSMQVGTVTPALPADLIRRLLAYKLQEVRGGGLTAATLRELRRCMAGEPAKPAAPQITAGARLIREWQGRTIVVDVEEDGFVYDGRCYTSLSSIAREVTGARWSGPRFFGVAVHA